MIKENKCKDCKFLRIDKTIDGFRYYCFRDKELPYKMPDDKGSCFVILDKYIK